jgi:SAM-dependent methyltransferase
VDWRLKCLAFHVLRYSPRSIHGFLQRAVTRRYFLQLTDDEFAAYRYHVDNFARLPAATRVLEFGAGSNLLTPLMLSAAGASKVLAYDLQRIATVAQVNHVIRRLRLRIPGVWPELVDLDRDLWRQYRIRYCAPADARHTGLAADSIDFFCSTSTLEHIPAPAIADILTECRRIASPHALFSFIIDYHDHYSTADARISRFNFYRYPPTIWRWLNPSNHYQNRLRHSDYLCIFNAQLLRPLEVRRVTVPVTELDRVTIGPEFAAYAPEDLASLNGFFLLTQAN